MSESANKYQELEAILTEMQVGCVSDERLEQLRAILRNDDQAQTIYAQQALTRAMLEWEFCDWRAGGNASADGDHLQFPPLPKTAAAAGGAPIASAPLPDGRGSAPNDVPKTPIVFNFLGPGGSGSYLGLLFAGLLAIIAVSAVAIVFRVVKPNNQAVVADAREEDSDELANDAARDPASPMKAVARLSGEVDSSWKNGAANFKTGSTIDVGQVLQLTSGVAELSFNTGVRVLMQSPASVAIESANSVRVTSGKLTTEITSDEGRGFKVLTEDATFTDQGTEFGIEVAPRGNSKIHVFKGAVDVALNAKSGAAYPIQRLEANSGARLEGELSQVTFVEDTGENFIRTLNDAEQDRHVVAYWRFEDHPVGTLVPSTTANSFRLSGTFDSSFNGNDLYAHTSRSRPRFSGDVPAELVPQNDKANRGSMDNTDPPEVVATRDVYTHSSFSHASPIDIQNITPEQWTIEASVKVQQLGKKAQTFVGRDSGLPREQSPAARLAFQLNDDDQFSIRYVDVEGRVQVATAGDFNVEANQWYNVAAVSTGDYLRLYVDCGDGRYQLVASTRLPSTGSTALSNGNVKAEWSVGRGRAERGPAEWFEGWIDEVRICDVALEPPQFLFSKSPTGHEVALSVY